MVRVGLIGLGAMGRVHFDCWRKSSTGKLTAISDRDPRKLAGEWGSNDFNLGGQAAEKIDLSDLGKFLDARELIASPDIDAVDIAMPTPAHAPLAIEALRAGKHVFCEKPMSLSLADCDAMIAAAKESGRTLVIGHCLRYWPHYLAAKAAIDSGEYGRPIHASFLRTGAAPLWSSGGWLMRREESGGVLDMHIHDIDVAVWWFGAPASVSASGHAEGNLPLIVDAIWRFPAGHTAHFHSGWDRNGGAFRHAFRLTLEKATIIYDLATDPNALIFLRDGKEERVPTDPGAAYQDELNDFAACVSAGRPITRLPLADSRLSVELGLEELRQLGC